MKTTEYNVKISGLNEHLRFAVIADLHGHVNPELTEFALGAMPDAVLMPGDIFDTRGNKRSCGKCTGLLLIGQPRQAHVGRNTQRAY